MKKVIAVCVFLGFLCDVCFALSCLECNPQKCKVFNPRLCKVGVTKDVCGCCPVCYKNVGEECGGPWDVFGFCGEHLTCKKPPSPYGEPDFLHEFNAKGKCQAHP